VLKGAYLSKSEISSSTKFHDALVSHVNGLLISRYQGFPCENEQLGDFAETSTLLVLPVLLDLLLEADESRMNISRLSQPAMIGFHLNAEGQQ
jgi:hypothetical protein